MEQTRSIQFDHKSIDLSINQDGDISLNSSYFINLSVDQFKKIIKFMQNFIDDVAGNKPEKYNYFEYFNPPSYTEDKLRPDLDKLYPYILGDDRSTVGGAIVGNDHIGAYVGDISFDQYNSLQDEFADKLKQLEEQDDTSNN